MLHHNSELFWFIERGTRELHVGVDLQKPFGGGQMIILKASQMRVDRRFRCPVYAALAHITEQAAEVVGRNYSRKAMQ